MSETPCRPTFLFQKWFQRERDYYFVLFLTLSPIKQAQTQFTLHRWHFIQIYLLLFLIEHFIIRSLNSHYKSPFYPCINLAQIYRFSVSLSLIHTLLIESVYTSKIKNNDWAPSNTGKDPPRCLGLQGPPRRAVQIRRLDQCYHDSRSLIMSAHSICSHYLLLPKS